MNNLNPYKQNSYSYVSFHKYLNKGGFLKNPYIYNRYIYVAIGMEVHISEYSGAQV